MNQWNKPLLGSRIDPEYPLSRGLLLCLLMNEGSGNRIYDYSRNGNDGIIQITGAIGGWIPGKTGPAIIFDGNDYINITPHESFFIDDFSLNIWMYPHALGTEYFFSGGYNNNPSLLFYYEGNAIRYSEWDGAIHHYLDGSAIRLKLNQWQLLTYVREGATILLYVDGVERATDTGVGVNAVKMDYQIGHAIPRNNAGALFDGIIENVNIWNRALSAQEVLDLYINPYGMIWDPRIYYIPNDPIHKFTAEHIDIHFIAESVDTHFIAEHL